MEYYQVDLVAPKSDAERHFASVMADQAKGNGVVYELATLPRVVGPSQPIYLLTTTHKGTALRLAATGARNLYELAGLLESIHHELGQPQFVVDIVNADESRGSHFVVRSTAAATVTFSLSPAGK